MTRLNESHECRGCGVPSDNFATLFFGEHIEAKVAGFIGDASDFKDSGEKSPSEREGMNRRKS